MVEGSLETFLGTERIKFAGEADISTNGVSYLQKT